MSVIAFIASLTLLAVGDLTKAKISCQNDTNRVFNPNKHFQHPHISARTAPVPDPGYHKKSNRI